MPSCKYQNPYTDKGCEKTVHGDNEYCILHKPDKNEEEAKEFYEEIKAEAKTIDTFFGVRYIFEDRVNWEGYIFPEIPRDEKGDQIFSFVNTEFKDAAIFIHGKFETIADFNSTTFDSLAFFHRVTFEGSAKFTNVDWNGEVVFGYTRFKKKGNFDYSIFQADANFGNAFFGSEASFRDAQFLGRSNFRHAKFGSKLNLSHTHFDRQSAFISDFDELEKGTSWRVKNRLEAIDFIEDLIFPVVKISIFTESDNQTGKKQSKNEKENGQVYSNKENALNKLKALANDEFSCMKAVTRKFATPQAKVAGCRQQRLTYENEGKKEEADQVFVHEMRARRETKNSRVQQFIDWLVADWTCKYGTSWQRVLGTSSGFILFFAFMYWGKKISLLVAEEGFGYVIAEHTADLFGRALFQSIMIFTTLGFSPRYFEEHTLLQVAAAVESILGALAVALVIVVFARKWMRG